jgi:transcriptional accessory protein Tex/SPT6
LADDGGTLGVDWDELKEGQIRTGRVVRIERYGVFVDLGAERPGLLHVREMGQYVREPSEVVKENESVEVRILRLDRQKRQIDLTMDLGNEPADAGVEEEPFLSPMEIAFNQAQQIKAVEAPIARASSPAKRMTEIAWKTSTDARFAPPTNTLSRQSGGSRPLPPDFFSPDFA